MSRSGEAEDILQESFIAAFRDLEQLTCETRVGAWLTGIAVHLVHRRFRKRRLLRRLGLDRGVDDASLEALSRSASQEALTELRRVDQVLKALAPDLRLAWMLRAVEGCDLAEVADQCGCSVATAKRRISAAQCAIEQVTRGLSGEGLG